MRSRFASALVLATVIAAGLIACPDPVAARQTMSRQMECSATLNETKRQLWKEREECEDSIYLRMKSYITGSQMTCTADFMAGMQQAQQDYQSCMGLR